MKDRKLQRSRILRNRELQRSRFLKDREFLKKHLKSI